MAHDPDRALWLAVIARAIEDACGRADAIESGKGYDRARARLTDGARAWIAGGGTNFRLVCDLAGLDPAGVQRAALRAIAAADAAPPRPAWRNAGTWRRRGTGAAVESGAMRRAAPSETAHEQDGEEISHAA